MGRPPKYEELDPKMRVSFQTQLTFADGVKGGHANAGKAMGVGTIADGPAVGTDGATFFGQLVLLEEDGVANIKTKGYMLLPLSGTATAGAQVVCAASGAVKAVTAETNGRGMILPIAAPSGFVWVDL